MPFFSRLHDAGQHAWHYCQSHWQTLLKTAAASLLSLGKIFSSAGSTLFSVQQTLITYRTPDPAPQILSILAVTNNVLLTSATRATPIYSKLLGWPARHPHDAPRPLEASPPVKAIYYGLLTLGYLSAPFSALNAYLSGATLMNAMGDLDEKTRISLASFVTVCSMVSYYSFNLDKMKKNIVRCCQALHDRTAHGTPFGLSTKTISWTLLSSFFGVIAGVGTSYISTAKSLDLFPLTKDFGQDAKTSIIVASLVASLFSSTFIFGISSYDQMKLFLEPSNSSRDRHRVPYYAMAMVFIDSTINSLIAFIGIIHLLGVVFDKSETDGRLIATGILPLLNNIFMNFALGLVGCHTATHWIQKQTSQCFTQTQEHAPLLAVSPPPLMTETRTIGSTTPIQASSSIVYSHSFYQSELPMGYADEEEQKEAYIDILPNRPSPSPTPLM